MRIAENSFTSKAFATVHLGQLLAVTGINSMLDRWSRASARWDLTPCSRQSLNLPTLSQGHEVG